MPTQKSVVATKEVPIGPRPGIFTLPLLGLLVTGLSASGLIDIFPPLVCFLLIFAVLPYAAGGVMGPWFGSPGGVEWPTRLASQFLTGLVFFAVVTWLCGLAGFSFSNYVTALLLISFFLFGTMLAVNFATRRDRVSSPPGSARSARAMVIVLVAAAVGVYYVVAFPPSAPGADANDHVGYIRAILTEDDLSPVGVLATPDGVAEAEADPRKGALHGLLAATCRVAGLEPAMVWRWLPVVLGPVAVLTFFAFSSSLLPGFGYAAGAVVLFLVLQRGSGFLTTVGSGRQLAMVYYWLLLVLCLEYGRTPGGRRLAGVCWTLVGGALIHFGVLIHFSLMLLSLMAFWKWFPFRRAAMIKLGIASAVCVVVIAVWVLSIGFDNWNYVHAHPQGVLYISEIGGKHFLANPVELYRQNGMAFLVGMCLAPGLLLVRRHKRFARRCLALSVVPIVIVMNPWLAPLVYGKVSYLLDRFVLNVPALVITALILGTVISRARRGGLVAKVAAALFLFAWAELVLVSDVGRGKTTALAPRVTSTSSGSVGDLAGVTAFVNAKIGSGSVLLSDPLTSYALSARCDVRVVAVPPWHAPPNDPHVFDRIEAVRYVLSEHASAAEAVRWMRRFDVDYVVLNGAVNETLRGYLIDWDPEAIGTLRTKLGTSKAVFDIAYDDGNIIMYKVTLPDEPVDLRWYPSLGFATLRAGGLLPCPSGDGKGLPRVTKLAVPKAEILAGEEMEMTLGYQRDTGTPSPLPAVVRIDLWQSGAPGSGPERRATLVERLLGRSRPANHAKMVHQPWDGMYPPQLWPLGLESFETFKVRIPGNLIEGTYEVGVTLEYEPLIPNASISGFLYGTDPKRGAACARVDVRHFVVR